MSERRTRAYTNTRLDEAGSRAASAFRRKKGSALIFRLKPEATMGTTSAFRLQPSSATPLSQYGTPSDELVKRTRPTSNFEYITASRASLCNASDRPLGF